MCSNMREAELPGKAGWALLQVCGAMVILAAPLSEVLLRIPGQAARAAMGGVSVPGVLHDRSARPAAPREPWRD
jgi:hypothetical protein